MKSDICMWPVEKVETLNQNGDAVVYVTYRYRPGGLTLKSEFRLPEGSPALFMGCELLAEHEFERIYEIRPACIGLNGKAPLDIYCYGTEGNASMSGDKQADTDHLPETPVFPGYTILMDPHTQKSVMISGDYGGYMESNMNEAMWSVKLYKKEGTVTATVGFEWLPEKLSEQGYVVDPGLRKDAIKQGGVVEKGKPAKFCDVYFTFATGNRDDAVNVIRKVFRKHVLLPLKETAPDMCMNVWFTDDDAERLYLELDFASWMGFDNITLDASWYEGGSVVPGRDSRIWRDGSAYRTLRFPEALFPEYSNSFIIGPMVFGR